MIIRELYNKYKYSLYSSIIFTFITHFYYFTKRLGNEDDLSYLIFSDAAITSGRWSDGTLFSTSLMSPVIKFLLVIIILSLCSVMICDLFKIKSKKGMIITSMILSMFPTLSISFSYLFMVEVYMLALLLAVFAVWVSIKYKYGFILGSLSIACSLGHYQSYIGISVALIIIYILKEILDKKDDKDVIKSIVKLLIMGVLGVVLYFVILKIVLLFNNAALSNYKGANSMGIPPLSEWGTQLFRTYKHFIGYFIGLSYYKVSLFESLFRILLILTTFIILVIRIIKEKLYLNKINFIILIVILLSIPLTFNIVDFMAYKAELSSLQIYQFSLFYILCFVILNKQYNNKKIKLVSNIVCILLVIISYYNFISTNSYYFKLEKYYSYTENFNNRLLNRIEGTKNYSYDMPVMFVGIENSTFVNNLYNEPYINDILTFDQALWGGKYIGYADLYSFKNDRKIFSMIENQFGVYLNRANDDERKTVKKSKEFKELKSYPSVDSIKIIEGVLVVGF